MRINAYDRPPDAYKTDDAGEGDPAKQDDGLWVDQAIDCLVRGNDCTGQNNEHDGDARPGPRPVRSRK